MHISGSAGFIGTVVTDRPAIAAKVPVTCHVLADDDREVEMTLQTVGESGTTGSRIRHML